MLFWSVGQSRDEGFGRGQQLTQWIIERHIRREGKRSASSQSERVSRTTRSCHLPSRGPGCAATTANPNRAPVLALGRKAACMDAWCDSLFTGSSAVWEPAGEDVGDIEGRRQLQLGEAA
jgi:hypothetical protein